MPTKKQAVAELAGLIGKQAKWTVKTANTDLIFDVVITDIEMHWGKTHYRIKPVSGSGEALVRDLVEVI